MTLRSGLLGNCSALLKGAMRAACVASALAALLLAPMPGSATEARNIVLMIGDGMGPSQIWAARLFSLRELGRDLRMVELMNLGRTAYLANDTADAIVTESAAAASQIACGIRVRLRSVGMNPDGNTPCRTILEVARDLGKSTGLVTTSGVTDATPAAFSAHVQDRSEETAIASQQLRLGVDVLLGGGRRHFLPESAGGSRKDGRNLLEEARGTGYALPQTPADLLNVDEGKILGLFSLSDMAFEIDRPNRGEPSIGLMAAKALEVLDRNPKGLFVMIEGGRIDDAGHRNDAAASVREVLAFDEAVGAVLDFQRRRPETLVIVTADHETGGMALTGTGSGTTLNFAAMRAARGSVSALLGELVENSAPEAVQSAVRAHLALEISLEDAQLLARETHRSAATGGHIPTPPLLANLLQRHLGIRWSTQGHTASPVFAFGSGPGSEHITGFRHNTELFWIMYRAFSPAQ